MSRNNDRLPLEILDPGASDPGYWPRLHRRVMASVAPELARRRMAQTLTVADVLRSWGRAVVPAALMAAMIAGLLLMRNGTDQPAAPMLTVEELLAAHVDQVSVPSVATLDENAEMAAFLAGLEGF